MLNIEGEDMQHVTIDDFAHSFGTTVEDFPNECLKMIRGKDFRYRRFDKKERDNIILQVLKKIEGDTQIIGATERKDVWEHGWAENLQSFVESGGDLDTLIPKFIRENQPIRYAGDYIMPANQRFEYDFMTVFRLWLFRKYLSPFDTIYEFGCGTGMNLVLLASLFPEKEFHGLDFVQSSVELINKIGESNAGTIRGRLFDMIEPDESLQLSQNSAVFTFGAIEQLADKFEKFIQFLLHNKPRLCIHIEPTIELYDEDDLFDYLAIKFHRKRGYTENLLPYLQELERRGAIRLIKVKRLYLGSLFMEGYTYYIWEPLLKE
ncbi:MAG: class I SAM-dependent methyltransferase [Syntrophales bacterium]|nr:class I SAM-dependent methyltransferase [Syntrophales bacterium]